MRQETYTLSQKELQRVSVISACIKGDMACARAAGLLCLSVRQIKRLKKRMREDGEAALAHANRGRPSHRRLPDAVRRRIVQLARGIYAGFNDHHLCEKLVEREGFFLSRETLRRLLRSNGLGSPRKRRAPAHRQRRARSARLGELVQLDGSPHDWLEGRGPQLTALGMQDDATGKILAAQFFPSETTFGYLCLLKQMLRRQQPPGQRPRRAPLGLAAGSPHQRTAPRQGHRYRLRQRRAAQVHRRLQSPFRQKTPRNGDRLA